MTMISIYSLLYIAASVLIMIYQYFKHFNWICTVFGMKKPFLNYSGIPNRVGMLDTAWSCSVIVALAILYFFWIIPYTAKSKNYMIEVQVISDVITNLLIILIAILKGDLAFAQVYQLSQNVLKDFAIGKDAEKQFVMKLYLLFSILTLAYITMCMMEFVYTVPPYSLFVRIPTYLTVLHLLFHMALYLSVTNKMNKAMLKMTSNQIVFGNLTQSRKCRKIFTLEMLPVDKNNGNFVDLSLYCRFYDDMSNCLRLLENAHGLQIVLSIGSMFLNAVLSVTLISLNEADYTWLVVVKGVLPFIWGGLLSFVGERLKMEVEMMDILIMKYLIDFKCDQTRRHILQTFKQLINTHGLQFKSCALFDLGYGMVLGTFVNVVTYSIILIQLYRT